MDPRTPSPTPQAAETACREATTRRKTRFYQAVDTRGDKTLTEVFEEQGLIKPTGYKWLRIRKLQGSPGTRRTGRHRPGRPPKIPDSTLT